MTDDDSSALALSSDGSRDRDNLLYDYSKHLLSLALIGIGGVITIAQSPLGKQIPGKQVGAVVVLLAVSGASALLCSGSVLDARLKGRPLPRSARNAYRSAMMFLGAGFGVFLMNWLELLF